MTSEIWVAFLSGVLLASLPWAVVWRKRLASEALLQSQLAELQARLQAHVETIESLKTTRSELKDQFEALSHRIFEEKSRSMREQNQTNLTALLDPLKQRIREFEARVEKNYSEEGRERHSLARQVRELMELNQRLASEARDLTEALKGSSKTQGVWGELILERILEAAGLRKGEEYVVQSSFTNTEGQRYQPDVIIYLPGERSLVVDSKVSLKAYEELGHAEDEPTLKKLKKKHLESVRSHIRGLSAKNYTDILQGSSLDFVLMFMPVEPAFMLAIAEDRDLYFEAFEKNVLLVSPSTLLFVLRTVAHLWKQEAQNQNSQEIARRGAELYDRLSGFVSELEKVGERLDQAQQSYDTAYKRLSSGRGNVLRQAEMLMDLGVQPKKRLPVTED